MAEILLLRADASVMRCSVCDCRLCSKVGCHGATVRVGLLSVSPRQCVRRSCHSRWQWHWRRLPVAEACHEVYHCESNVITLSSCLATRRSHRYPTL